MERPFSQACENNKEPILAVIQSCFADCSAVLEVGSGTGQHAVYFAQQMPHLQWQPMDQQEYIQGIEQWVDWAQLKNISAPIVLDVSKPWPASTAPAIFSANTLHIMGWQEVEIFFEQIKSVLASPGVLCIYGPFNYSGQFTSDSNRQFDQWLKARNPYSGIRDFEAVNELANSAGLTLISDNPMPANNRCLVWKKDHAF